MLVDDEFCFPFSLWSRVTTRKECILALREDDEMMMFSKDACVYCDTILEVEMTSKSTETKANCFLFFSRSQRWKTDMINSSVYVCWCVSHATD